jgi:hypothetical protein
LFFVAYIIRLVLRARCEAYGPVEDSAESFLSNLLATSSTVAPSPESAAAVGGQPAGNAAT